MTVTDSLAPDRIIVKTTPTTWVVVDPDEQAAIRSLAPRVYAELSRRLNCGSPFETPAGAWVGQEELGSAEPVTACVGIAGKAVYVKLSTRHLDFGQLTVAQRLGKGAYEVYLSEAGFFAWIERLAPSPRTPAELVADELKAVHPELASRIDKALELVKAGTIEFPHYQTGAMLTTNPPTRRCSCPDAEFRAPQVAGIGQACKHCLAQYIAETIKQEAATVAARKFADKWAMKSDSAAALPVWVDQKDSLEDWLQ